MKKLLSILLAAVMIFSFVACSGTQTPTDASTTAGDNLQVTHIGEGEKSFDFTVVDADGRTMSYKVSTDKETVGEALLDAKLIEGENGPYGLYVKSVAGKTYDYDKDGKYWAFYVNGEMSPTGVDMTDITDGSSYMFKAE